MNILYLITYYRVGDGTSLGLYSQIEMDRSYFSNYMIVTKKIFSSQEDLNIIILENKQEIIDFAKQGPFIIHYFRGSCSNILLSVLQIVGFNIPVITTVCQSPSYNNLWLTPFELKHSWHFVFIDKSAYENLLINFIPTNAKTQIYLASKFIYRDFSSIPSKKNDNYIVFGRGSTSGKCPPTMFEVFDRIELQNKFFRIVGIEDDCWIREEASSRSNVEVLNQLPQEEWEKACNTFDVFLYQLPDDCYASIDGTLGLAMLLGKPVVYMGCDAPKERFQHGENGFVANTIEEMAYYATLLGKDKELREKIGEAGRRSTIRDFRPEVRERKYIEVYKSLDRNVTFKIPYRYKIKFILKNKQQAKIYLMGQLRYYFPKVSALFYYVKKKYAKIYIFITCLQSTFL